MSKTEIRISLIRSCTVSIHHLYTADFGAVLVVYEGFVEVQWAKYQG
jgi:hypothetical protein